MREAVIGIGSNSLRMLVADHENGRLRTVLRDRAGLRVFASLDSKLNVAPEMIRLLSETINAMKCKALSLHAQTVRLFATSAVRDAANQQEIIDVLAADTGLLLTVCSGELEAKLSFIGAAGFQKCGMIDIGGGSTEIVIGEGETIGFSASIQAGAVRLYREMPIETIADADRVKTHVKELVALHFPQLQKIKTPTVWVGVGGTMTAAATYLRNIDWDAAQGVEGFIVGRSALQHAVANLTGLSKEQRRAIQSIPPDRADIVVHGFAILLACMDMLHIDGIQVTERTNLDGYLLVFTTAGSGSTA